MILNKLMMAIFAILMITACGKIKEEPVKDMNDNSTGMTIDERLAQYVPTKISADLSQLTENEKKVVELLCKAGQLADAIFWMQISPDAIPTRDSLRKLTDPEGKKYYEYCMINYGPYDFIDNESRFVGSGLPMSPKVANYYPQDMTKEEFEKYIKDHPEQKSELENQYTIVVRENEKLKSIPFGKAYPQIEQMAKYLEEAASFADNKSLKKYLMMRATAIRNDDYFDSDMQWMDIKDSKIDVVIGPIENYQDKMFNYKTAYEAVVMVKDPEATKLLDMFESNINNFEQTLPYDKKYIRKSAGKDNILQVVNVVYFGGDCQRGTKTIAASLPNDPKVHELKGGKKSMYRNMMEAKFEKVVKPIADKIIDPKYIPDVNATAFTAFVTLHEVSHTLGRGYVYGNDALPVRKALKERYSAIEETKADIVGMYNHKYLLEKGFIDSSYIKRTIATYLPGLFRSIRFGSESAHGKANLIQFNFLLAEGAILKMKDGKFTINEAIFFDKVAELCNLILTTQATGDYEGAGNILEKYGIMTTTLEEAIAKLKEIPRDLNTTYDY